MKKPFSFLILTLPLAIMSAVFMLCSYALIYGQDRTIEEGAKTKDAQQLLAEADGIFKSHEYEKSREIYLMALDAAEKEGNESDKAEALAMVARTYLIVDDIKTGKEWLEKAKKAAEFDQPLGWSRYVGVLGRFLWKEKFLKEATITFENLYQYCSERKLHEQAIDAAHMVAITGDIETQTRWARKAIDEAEKGGLDSWLGPLWNNLGATYEDASNFYQSLESYNKAREYHYKTVSDFNKAVADWTVGHAYVNIGDMKNAERWLLPVLPKFEKMNETEFIGLTCRELGKVELEKKNYQSAHDYFIRAKAKLKEAKMPEWDPEGYQKILDRISETKGK